ncbi:hypothetical protein ACH4Q6_14160 [Streptomyces lydicus]|uniref:hypothetical protein n=1 Tax=Streptomyces lydicus TaxID=47763 RepID=UPI0037AD6193
MEEVHVLAFGGSDTARARRAVSRIVSMAFFFGTPVSFGFLAMLDADSPSSAPLGLGAGLGIGFTTL